MATSTQVIEAIKEARVAGWAVRGTAFGYLVTSPASEVDHPTPDYVPSRWWPEKTYRKLSQLAITVDGYGRVTYAAIRTSPGPWVGTREVRVSLKKAIEFLRSDHGEK